jgi:4'-phosphopantetheinyl transferase
MNAFDTSYPFIRMHEVLPGVPLCAVDIAAVLKEYFPGTEILSPAIPLPLFDRFLFETGIKVPENFSEFRVFKRQIEHLCGRAAFAQLDRIFLSGGHFLSKRESGEPFIQGLDIPVSISHAGNYACAGICTRSGRIGIDIERIRPFNDRVSFFRIAFPEQDSSDLMSLSDNEIMRLWTMKEAFLKIIGMGFAENLGAVRIVGNEITYNGKTVPLEIGSIEFDNHLLSVIISDEFAAKQIENAR